jgi:hypothetical protein
MPLYGPQVRIATISAAIGITIQRFARTDIVGGCCNISLYYITQHRSIKIEYLRGKATTLNISQ